MLGNVALDASDLDRYNKHWSNVRALLDAELKDARGGAKVYLTANPWGTGNSGVRSLYG